MHRSYHDILSRIAEPPQWWLNGVPRYCEFKPALAAEWQADAVLLVHIRCQSCKADFHIALGDRRRDPQISYGGMLNTKTELGIIGDPPYHSCRGAGDSMTAEEVAVLEFWVPVRAPQTASINWERRPEFERSLEEPDSARIEQHREAWARIRRFRERTEGTMVKWTPTYLNAPLGGPMAELEVPIGLPAPPIYRTPTTGKFIDRPKLNQRRRLAILALSGKITAEEFADLKERSQTEYGSYEERPPAPRPDWAEPLVEEVKSIDETVMANAIPGWLDMTPEQREESYCPRPRILKTLRELALSGRITPEEHKQVLDNLIDALSR